MFFHKIKDSAIAIRKSPRLVRKVKLRVLTVPLENGTIVLSRIGIQGRRFSEYVEGLLFFAQC